MLKNRFGIRHIQSVAEFDNNYNVLKLGNLNIGVGQLIYSSWAI